MNDRLGDIGDSPDVWMSARTVGTGNVEETKVLPPRKKRKLSWRNLKLKAKNKKQTKKASGGVETVQVASSLASKSRHDDDTLGDIELGEQPSSQPKYMKSFFREVDNMKADIDFIREATNIIREINEEALTATSTEKEKELSIRLQPLVNETNGKAKRTKTVLSLLKDENIMLKEEKEIKESDLRIRENLVNTLTRKFIDEVKLYQNAQQMYKKDIKSKASRQIRTIKPDATDEEIDVVIRSEGGRDALYKETILKGGVADPINTTYEKVSGKYQDVLTLEQSLSELHEMFVDMALLTEQQGELLDHIEIHVQNASDDICKGNDDLVKSIGIQKAIRKKQGWIILIVVVVVTVIVLSILL